MFETIRSCSHHTLFGVIAEGIPTFLHSVKSSVNQVGLSILTSAALFYLHHNLFAVGFVVGFVADQAVETVVEKVNVVYNAHQTLLEQTLFFGGGGFLAVLTMPTSMVIATLYYSAQWGSLLYQSSRDRYPFPSPNIDGQKKETEIT